MNKSKHSKYGVTSFFLSWASIISFFLLIYTLINLKNPGIIPGIFGVVSLGSILIGLIFGSVGLFDKKNKRLFSIFGFLSNITLLTTLNLVIINQIILK